MARTRDGEEPVGGRSLGRRVFCGLGRWFACRSSLVWSGLFVVAVLAGELGGGWSGAVQLGRGVRDGTVACGFVVIG